MITVILLIPLADNDKVTFAPDHHRAFEIALAEFFGGFTLLPMSCLGAWVDNGRLYTDQTRAYQVAVKGMVESGAALADCVALARAHYRQETIYLTYLGVAEIVG